MPSDLMPKLSYQLMTTVSEIEKLKDCWVALLQSCSHHTIFQTWEWQFTWLTSFDTSPHVLLIFAEDELIAILPFFKIKKLRFYLLRLIGSPDSDYLDFIIKQGFEREVITFFFMNILYDDHSIGIVELDSVSELSPSYSLIPDIELKSFYVVDSQKTCPYILLPRSWDEYLQSLSPSTRYFIRRKTRKLHRDFCVTMGLTRTERDMDSRMENFIVQHQKRWESLDKPGAFAVDGFAAFHRQVARKLFQQDWLRLYFLELNGQPAASYYLFYHQNSLYFYLSGFDPAYSRYSPSAVLMAQVIKDAITGSCEEFDMMRGVGAYKYKWSSHVRRNRSYTILRKTPSVWVYRICTVLTTTLASLIKTKMSARAKLAIRRAMPRRVIQTLGPFFRA